MNPVPVYVLSLVVVLTGALAPATAGEITFATVHKLGTVYDTSVVILIDAPLPAVYASITDYQHLSAINPLIEESAILSATDPEHYRVRSVIKVCILIYCKHITQVQDLTHRDDHTIEAEMVPGMSDFRSGHARWRLVKTGRGTKLVFTHRFEPSFWVPPVIGTWMIRRTLEKEIRETVRHIEQLAAGSREP